METLFAAPALLDTLEPQLQALITPDPPAELRAWVAGCESGEDAYACAILLREVAASHAPAAAVKVFATDSSQSALRAARRGSYPAERLAALSPARRRFFSAAGGELQVSAEIREMLIFATHSLLSDPPFSRLSLVVCRTLCADLSPAQRLAALARFAAALRPGGLLLLGAEPPGGGESLVIVDREQKLYARADVPAPALAATAAAGPRADQAPPTHGPALLSRLPALIVDQRWQIIQLGAGVDHFLRIPRGSPTHQLLDVVHPQLREVVEATVARAVAGGRAAESAAVDVRLDSTAERVTVIAQPAGRDADDGLLVLFETSDPAAPPALLGRALANERGDLHDHHLLNSLEHEMALEELQVASEELRVVNEEFQVASQDLDALNEELQTLNEELLAVNRGQARTLEQLRQLSDDLQNLMASSDVGTLFLDCELRVRCCTPQLQSLFHLRPEDLGRPLAHFKHDLSYPELLDDARQLLAELRTIEREVAHRDGRWFMLRLRPYRGDDGQIGGVVLNLLDISERVRAEVSLRQAHADLERRVHERTTDLEQSHATRKALLRELVQAQERERLRIARDLHDHFGQQITAILLGLRAAQNQILADSPALAPLEGVRSMVQTMGKEIHRVASDLRPTALDDVGLAEALQSYTEDWSRQTGLTAAFFETGVRGSALPQEVETTIYRVAIEALTNVARHAVAKQVNLVLERHQGMLIMMIEDDGRGFDVENTLACVQEGEHIGLLGMYERVALLDGTLTVESTPGSGSTVIARIPLTSSGGAKDVPATDPAGR